MVGVTRDMPMAPGRALRTIRGNLVWASGHNVAALPIAALGVLNPWSWARRCRCRRCSW